MRLRLIADTRSELQRLASVTGSSTFYSIQGYDMSFPFFDEVFTFHQPDGTTLTVRGWGDQDHAVFETIEGYTVIRDPVSGFYQYAAPNPEGSELHPTPFRAGSVDPASVGLPIGVRLTRTAAKAHAELGVRLPEPRWKTRREQFKTLQARTLAANMALAPPSRQTVGDFVGLCLLVQFPDVPGSISHEQVEAFCNQPGYQGFGNNGSVRDYFLDNSAGKLRYSTVIAPYYTARHPKAYYTNPSVPYGQRARELIQEALAFHVSQGFNFSGLTVDDHDYVFATNVFYAGSRVNDWSQGLWPHASRLLTPYQAATGILAYDYQITDMADSLTLGTYCHENGHMLCDFPDLYDYGAPGIRSGGVGAYCLMCAGGNADKRNPTQVSAYLKYQAGWASSVTEISADLSAIAPAVGNHFFVHARSPAEYFIIENRLKSGRDKALPDSGLAIWHIDVLGNNSNEQMTLKSHYECSLEQSDGLFDLERGDHTGDDRDLFHAGWKDSFSNHTVPSSKWWDGSSSGLVVSNISAPGPDVKFQIDIVP